MEQQARAATDLRRRTAVAVLAVALLSVLAAAGTSGPAAAQLPPFQGPDAPRVVLIAPQRVMDSRTYFTATGAPAPVRPGAPVSFSPLAQQFVGPLGVAAVILNVTATNVRPDAGAGCFLRAYPTAAPEPATSNLNVVPGQTLPNLVVIPVGDGGRVSIGASCTVDVVVDVEGWIQAGAGYVPVSPTRVADTRAGSQVGPVAGPIPALTPVTIRPLEALGIPAAGVDAVLANVTVVAPSGGGYLSAWPTGGQLPNSSVLNFSPGETFANAQLVKLGADGGFEVLVAGGSAHVLVDVFGWTTSGGSIRSLAPVRMLDTRPGSTVGDCGGPCATLGPGGTASVLLSGTPGLPAGATGVVVKVTATEATADTYLTLWASGQPQPFASSLNLGAGDTVPNLVYVPLGADGRVNVINAAGRTDVLFDVVGATV